MPIEFRCTDCAALLRTPDDTAGRQAKCPKCGKVLMVPDAAAAVAAPPMPPQAPSGEPSPMQAPPPPSPAYGAPPSGEYNPYQAPTAADALREVPIQGGPIVASTIDVFDVVKTIWRVHIANLGLGVLAWIVVMLCTAPLWGVMVATMPIQQDAMRNNIPLYLAIVLVQQVIGALYGSFFFGGFTRLALKASRRARPSIGDLFSGGRFTIRLFLWQLLVMVIPALFSMIGSVAMANNMFGVGLGIMLVYMVSMVYLTTTYLPAPAIIVDRDASFGDAMRASAAITKGNKISFFFVLLLSLISLYAGFLLLCIGIFLTIPLMMYVIPVSYLRLSGQPVAGDAYLPAAPAYAQ